MLQPLKKQRGEAAKGDAGFTDHNATWLKPKGAPPPAATPKGKVAAARPAQPRGKVAAAAPPPVKASRKAPVAVAPAPVKVAAGKRGKAAAVVPPPVMEEEEFSDMGGSDDDMGGSDDDMGDAFDDGSDGDGSDDGDHPTYLIPRIPCRPALHILKEVEIVKDGTHCISMLMHLQYCDRPGLFA